jgi:acyl-CoA reductase-like NAD-dependent aldehyde dehydrogenase
VDKAQFDKVMNYINIGKSEGATLSAGGGQFGDAGCVHLDP